MPGDRGLSVAVDRGAAEKTQAKCRPYRIPLTTIAMERIILARVPTLFGRERAGLFA